MTPRQPIPDVLWDRIPEDVREALRVVFDFHEARTQQLEATIAELLARLQQTSSNSHKPPSSDLPKGKPAPPIPKQGRKQGGQPGHPKVERVRLPTPDVVDHKPCRCKACGLALSGDDPNPRFHQVWELPEIRPHVTEHRIHTLTCPCGHATLANTTDVPTDGYGPRLKASLVYLTGVTHLSKSQTEQLCEDLLGFPISTGQVCDTEAELTELLAPVMQELHDALPAQDINMDETGWKQSGKRAWLWVAVAPLFTFFHIAFSRGRKVVEHLLGADYAHVLTTDRCSAYARVANRQLCWAHLRRDFQAVIDRGGAGKEAGEMLLLISNIVFDNWHQIRDGTLSREAGIDRILNWFAPEFRLTLESGTRCGCARTQRFCATLLGHWDSLWAFCRVAGVEPTNNSAERALRPAVMWRKRSQGTRSEVGSRYVATMLSVSATCKQQKRGVWLWLTQVFNNAKSGKPMPSLLPTS